MLSRCLTNSFYVFVAASWLGGLNTIVRAAPLDGTGFVTLDQRTESSINGGNWLRWVHPPVPSHLVDSLPAEGSARASTGRVVLSYQVDDQFMANQAPAVRDAALQAVVSALDSWSQASNGFVRFERSIWDTVSNDDATFHSFFAGPSIDWWCQNYCIDCQGCPGGAMPLPNPLDLFPGWGADIDIISVGSNFSLVSNGVTYQMTPTLLGFAAVHRSAGSIWSADIYINHDFTWTTGGAAASMQAQAGVRLCGCSTQNSQPIVSGSTLPAPNGSRGTAFDIETVVLHELGHVLGLDHPNEACLANGAMMDPWTHEFITCDKWSPEQVMHGGYTGIKRTLTNSDIGGLAFLYLPALPGDMDGDGQLAIRDLIHAFDSANTVNAATPYDTNIMDFIVRNGRIDMVELSQLIRWVIDPGNNPPGVIQASAASVTSTLPATITVAAMPNPTDIGLGSSVEIVISMNNPQLMPVQGWEIRLLLDETVFSNPVLLNGTVLASSPFFPPSDGSPGVRIAKIAFSPEIVDSGVIATILLDVDLAASALVTSPTLFSFSQVSIVVSTDPPPHDFGTVVGETLIAVNGSALANHYDANADGEVTAEDRYVAQLTPIDVNKDGSVDGFDHMLHILGIRQREPEDVAPGP